MKKLAAQMTWSSSIAILGPRQVGKTTLAHEIAKEHDAVYFDLENYEDLSKLNDPLKYLPKLNKRLIILDEIQRKPDMFNDLRVLIDRGRQLGREDTQFLILGSASMDLLKQASESLAGRIAYLELASLNVLECNALDIDDQEKLWLRGGFPKSYLAKDEYSSIAWRENFITTYLERDVPMFAYRVPAATLRSLWTMLAHLQASTINASSLANNLSVSTVTIKRYIDLLVDLLLLRKIQPWHKNVGKRLVKSPKVYVRDSGLTHQLLKIRDKDMLLTHPVVGKSWEAFVIENIMSVLPQSVESYHYRTHTGAEIDLILKFSDQDIWAIEIKRNLAPKLNKGFYIACEDIAPSKQYVVYGGQETYSLKGGVVAISLPSLMQDIQKLALM